MRYSHCQLGALLSLLSLSAAAPTEPTRAPRHATVISSRDLLSSYTFIIAGGGIAGLTLADRLTEDPNGELPLLGRLLLHEPAFPCLRALR